MIYKPVYVLTLRTSNLQNINLCLFRLIDLYVKRLTLKTPKPNSKLTTYEFQFLTTYDYFKQN